MAENQTLKKGDKVRLDTGLKFIGKENPRETINLFANILLTCASREKDGYVEVVGHGVSACISTKWLILETLEDLD